MGGDPGAEAVAPHGELQRVEVPVRQLRHVVVDDLVDADPLLGRGQRRPGPGHLPGRVVTAGPAEDEEDGGQEAVLVEAVDQVGPLGGEPAVPGPAARAAAAADPLGVERRALGVRPVGDQGRDDPQRVLHRVGHGIEVLELHRSVVLDDRRRGPPYLGEPGRQLLRVRHRGRQADQAHVGRDVDDHLLPHRPPVGVLEVVDLVEHDEAQVLEVPAGVDHVAEDLGGHHDHLGVSVDAVVAREQADSVGAVAPHQVAVLLVRQGLDRRRVEDPAVVLGQHPVDGVLGHHGLAGSGRSGDQHRLPPVDGRDRLLLERVEDEGPGHGASAATRRRVMIRPIRIESS